MATPVTLVPDTPGGTMPTQPVSEADGANVTLGAKADAKSTATDTTAVTAMSVWKQISASVQSLVTGITIAAAQTIATVTTVTTVATVTAVTAITNALPAGTNLLGRIAADASAATGGIPSTARLLSAAGSSGDATNVKASAGRLYAIQGANVATVARYLKLYNSATAPTAGAGTPVKTLYLPPSSAFTFDWPLGLTFSAGIGFTLVTTSPDAGATSVTAADILALNIDYA